MLISWRLGVKCHWYFRASHVSKRWLSVWLSSAVDARDATDFDQINRGRAQWERRKLATAARSTGSRLAETHNAHLERFVFDSERAPFLLEFDRWTVTAHVAVETSSLWWVNQLGFRLGTHCLVDSRVTLEKVLLMIAAIQCKQIIGYLRVRVYETVSLTFQ